MLQTLCGVLVLCSLTLCGLFSFLLIVDYQQRIENEKLCNQTVEEASYILEDETYGAFPSLSWNPMSTIIDHTTTHARLEEIIVFCSIQSNETTCVSDLPSYKESLEDIQRELEKKRACTSDNSARLIDLGRSIGVAKLLTERAKALQQQCHAFFDRCSRCGTTPFVVGEAVTTLDSEQLNKIIAEELREQFEQIVGARIVETEGQFGTVVEIDYYY